ncbi:MAG: GMP synthase [Cyclobacteriaceae bacterium]|nr:GMP synthase [Cyclobacteriaceae bacterium]UYN88620.1 MAG: GMP synthase [Cyclobacteriaceae bacterium]
MPNEGMRGIRQLIQEFTADSHLPVTFDVFDVRLQCEVPGTDYDIYISSGGPGSPLDSKGSLWERKYFALMDALHEHNARHPQEKKHVLLICHSFQLYCRHYGYAKVSKRKSTSFGVMPVHKTDAGMHEPLFRSLNDPLWAVDSRDYQITEPDVDKIEQRGGALLAIEKYRPHVHFDRAVMAIRFDEAFIGTQFHPEADAPGMRMYLLREDKKELVIQKHGEKKYWDMLDHLGDPDKIMATYHAVVPRFLMMGLQTQLSSVLS